MDLEVAFLLSLDCNMGTKIAEKLSFKLSRDLKADEIVFRWCLTSV